MTGIRQLGMAIVLSALMCPLAVHAAQMPEFGTSIQLDKEAIPITVGRLQGKIALMVFFQSW